MNISKRKEEKTEKKEKKKAIVPIGLINGVQFFELFFYSIKKTNTDYKKIVQNPIGLELYSI